MNRIWSRRSSAASCGLRLLDLDDQLGRGKDLGGAGQDAGAGGLVGPVVKADPGSGPALDDDFVAVMGELAHAAGNQPDPVFVGLHLFGNPDQHRLTSTRPPAGSDFRPSR